MHLKTSNPLVLSTLVATSLLIAAALSGPALAQNSYKALVPQYDKASQAGDYAAAERVARRMVAVTRKRVGRKHINHGLSLNSLALALLNQQRFADAIPQYKAAIKVYERNLGRTHAAIGDMLNNQANAHFSLGQTKAAIPLYKRALKIYKKRLKPDNPSIANTIGNMASAYYRQGSYREALPLLERKLALVEKSSGAASKNTAFARQNVADVLHLLGQLEKSLALFEDAHGTFIQVIGEKSDVVANSYGNLANVKRSMGRYDDAIADMERSRDIFIEVRGPRDESVGNTLNNLANIYKQLNRLGEAAKLYKQALDIYDGSLPDDHINLGNTRENLAGVYADQRRFDEAMPLLRRAIAIKEKSIGTAHPNIANTYLNYAAALNVSGAFDEALDYYEKALKIYRKVYGPNHTQTALALDSMGTVSSGLGKFSEAAQLHRKALAIREKALGKSHRHVLDSVLNLANAEVARGQSKKAAALYKRASALAGEIFAGPDPTTVKIQSQLSFLNEREGRLAQALAAARKASETVTALQKRATAAASDADDRRTEPFGHIYEQLVRQAYRVAESKKAGRAALADEAFAAAQRRSATSVSAALSQMAARFGADSKSLGKVVREQQDSVSELQAIEKALIAEFAKPAKSRDKTVSAKLRGQRDKAARKLARLSTRLERDFPDYGELTNPSPLQIKGSQKLLAEDEALVVFLPLEADVFVWAITRDSMRWRKLAKGVTAETLSDRVAKIRKRLQFESLQAKEFFDLKSAHALYTDLFGPVEDVIAEKKKLLIVSSGALTSLPFNVLVTDAPPAAVPQDMSGYRDASWLIKRHAIAILPSVSSLRALRRFASKTRAKDAFIGYGNPDFGSGETGEVRGAKVADIKTRSFASFYKAGGQVDLRLLSESLPPLPDTADELRHVAGKLGADEDQVRLGTAATEASVKSANLEDYRVVYFATHGLVAGDLEKLGSTAAEPALALTVPAKPSDVDNGLLTASEVAQLKLNADWVVLSACNTAAGDKPGAEALSGLAKSFIYAGARAMLVSHWPVASSAAVTLTSQIFDARAADPELGKAEALQQSMLALLQDDKDPLNAYPSVWAPFIVVGD